MPPDVLRDAHQYLPWWVVWADEWLHPLIAAVLCGVVALALVTTVGFFTRKPAGEHWAERARAAWPVRCALGNFIWVGPTLCLVMEFLLSGSWSPVPRGVGAGLSGLGALLAVGMVACRYEHRIGRRATPGVEASTGFVSRIWTTTCLPMALWLRGFAATLLVRVPHIGVMVVMLLVLPPQFDLVTVAAIVGGAVVMLWLATGGNLLLASRVGLARRAGPRLQRIVDDTSEAVGVPAGQAYEVLMSECNAYAFPLRGRLGFTTDLLEHLSDEEVGAICAHELGHVAEGVGVRLARLSLVPVLAVFGAMLPITATFGVNVALVIIVVSLLLSRWLRRLARKMEHRADQYGQRHDPDQQVYARALEKIYQRNFVPAVISEKAVHPALYDRMLSAGVQPDFARPDPPANRLWVVALALSVTVVCGWFLFRDHWVVHRLRQTPTSEVRGVHVTLALASQSNQRAAALMKLIYAEQLQWSRNREGDATFVAVDRLAERHRAFAQAAQWMRDGTRTGDSPKTP